MIMISNRAVHSVIEINLIPLIGYTKILKG